MRIGTSVGLQVDGPQTIDDVVAEVRRAAELGLTGAWWSQTFGWDALTAIVAAGLAVPDIELGTAVVPTYPRHPLALASQALSTRAAVGDRLTLGVGPSHAPIIEGALGVPFDRPARHTREYLEALGAAAARRGRRRPGRGDPGGRPGGGARGEPAAAAALGPRSRHAAHRRRADRRHGRHLDRGPHARVAHRAHASRPPPNGRVGPRRVSCSACASP